ncbi:hypothetical protein RYA05_02800 [Pseudomonas syringae pv. actinidiae]|nr:hypothetical protein [Pseudomonas syringae pv. actinidiae]
MSTQDFSFDVKLNAVVRVSASSEAEARLILAEVLDCATAHFGESGDAGVVGEASLDGEPVLSHWSTT